MPHDLTRDTDLSRADAIVDSLDELSLSDLVD